MSTYKMMLIVLFTTFGFFILCFMIYFWTELVKISNVPEPLSIEASQGPKEQLQLTTESSQASSPAKPAPELIQSEQSVTQPKKTPERVQKTVIIVPEFVPQQSTPVMVPAASPIPVNNEDPKPIIIDLIPSPCQVPFCRGAYEENISNYKI